MKICFIADSIFNIGGVQRVVSVIANQLSETNEVSIMCINNNYPIDRQLYNLSNNIKVEINKDIVKSRKNFLKRVIYKIGRRLVERDKIHLNYKLLFDLYYSNIRRDKLIEYINKKNYDVVIAIEGNNSVILGSIANRLKAKTVGWQHNSFDAYFNNPFKYYWKQDEIFKKYLAELDYCIVLTDYDKAKYIKNFNKDIKCITIYNPLSFESECKSYCTNKNILFVGRLVKEQKGLDMLIEIFKKVHAKRPDWSLTIVGDGKDKKALEESIKNNDLKESVHVFPHTSNIIKHYINASIFISTSRWEGFGLVITEAMECGLPVVAFNNSGPQEIIESMKNGILVEKYDIENMIENLIYLIDNKTVRCSIAKNAIERAQDFNMRNIMRKWIEILK